MQSYWRMCVITFKTNFDGMIRKSVVNKWLQMNGSKFGTQTVLYIVMRCCITVKVLKLFLLTHTVPNNDTQRFPIHIRKNWRQSSENHEQINVHLITSGLKRKDNRIRHVLRNLFLYFIMFIQQAVWGKISDLMPLTKNEITCNV